MKYKYDQVLQRGNYYLYVGVMVSGNDIKPVYLLIISYGGVFCFLKSYEYYACNLTITIYLKPTIFQKQAELISV